MFTVTAVYQGCEIGFGEGESYDYAMNDAIDSIDSQYKEFCSNEIVLRAISSTLQCVAVETQLSLWLSLTA